MADRPARRRGAPRSDPRGAGPPRARDGQIVPDLPPPVRPPPRPSGWHCSSRSGWLGRRAATPVLLVLDDLHWADMGTLLLLRHVVANSPVPGLLAVGTYRDTDLDRTHPLSTMLSDFHRRATSNASRSPGWTTGCLRPHGEDGGHDLDESGMALALALHQDTGGNPFFVGEVLRHLAERGSITQEGGRWVASRLDDDEYLPEGIRQVVGRRLSVLPEGTQKILSSASVVGARFDLDLLSAVTDVRIDELLDAIEPAIDAHLVLETGVGRYQFAHAPAFDPARRAVDDPEGPNASGRGRGPGEAARNGPRPRHVRSRLPLG